MQDLNVTFAEGIMRLLQQGNERYLRRGRPQKQGTSSSVPVVAAVLTCSDLKEDVHSIFGLEGADLFVMTQRGLAVGPDEIAGASFALDMHDVKLVLVLGHSGCDVLDIYLSGGHIEPVGLRHAFDDSRQSAIANGAPISKPDLVRTHTCRMAQVLRSRLASTSELVVVAAQFDESRGRVLFF